MKVMTNAEFKILQSSLFKRLLSCLSHDNIRTMQRTLQFFRCVWSSCFSFLYTVCVNGWGDCDLWYRNEAFISLITPHTATLIPLLLPSLYRRGEIFWNVTVNKMTAVVLKKLMVR